MAHHVVQVHIHTFPGKNGADDNTVAVVAPASFDFMDGDTVEFTCEADDVSVWFPKVWYSAVSLTVGGELMELEAVAGGEVAVETPAMAATAGPRREFAVPRAGQAAQLVLKVDADMIPKGNKLVPYQVYCGSINEFAVGDSPPKMVLKP
jgi:hypothetical protein